MMPNARAGLPPALLTFLVSVLFTGGAWQVAVRGVERAEDLRFDREVVEIENALRARWAAQEQVLRSGVAFLAADPGATSEDWRVFVDGLDLEVAYPGIQGVGWSVRIDPTALDAHEEEYGRRLATRGITEYDVYPVPGRELTDSVVSSIVWLEPLDERNRVAIALDMWSEENRRTAMSRAWRTGEPALSGKILLVQEIDADRQPGFLLYLPVYGSGGELVGWVYSPFRARDLMNGILAPTRRPVSFEVYDGAPSEASILFDADGSLSLGESGPGRRLERTLRFAGREWTVRYSETESVLGSSETRLPGIVLAFGFLVSILLSTIVWSLGRTRSRALELANQMTEDLRRSEAEQGRLAEELMRSNSDLEEFAYVASHDLQEPARTTQAYLGLLEAEVGDELGSDARESLEIAKSGARRMRVIVRDLLEYSRASKSDLVERSRVELDDVAAEVKADLREAIDASGAEVVVSAGMPALAASGSSLQRVLENLVSNAIKYRHPERPPRIEVRAMRSGDEVRIEVEDNGLGVEDAHLERIFQMHTRLHTRDRIPGNGMGLAICRQLVERLGGRIGVESEPGRGSTFWFTMSAWTE